MTPQYALYDNSRDAPHNAPQYPLHDALHDALHDDHMQAISVPIDAKRPLTEQDNSEGVFAPEV